MQAGVSCLKCAEGGVGNDQHSGHGDLLQEVVNEEGKVGGPNLMVDIVNIVIMVEN